MDTDNGVIAFMVIFCVAFGLVVGLLIGWSSTSAQWKADAVKCGYGEWEMANPETGRTVFRWIDNTGDDSED